MRSLLAALWGHEGAVDLLPVAAKSSGMAKKKISLKTPEELKLMRAAGLVVWQAHQAAAAMMVPGMSTAQVNLEVERVIAANGGQALFKGAPGPTPFPAAACISVNNAVVHGIPDKTVLREGDVVSMDIGVRLKGWCGDAAVTHRVGRVSPLADKLLSCTEEALRRCIQTLRPGQKWRKYAKAMDEFVRSQGFHSVTSLGGHGIGRELWEPPHITQALTRDFEDFEIVEGMVIAIEPMVNVGTSKVFTAPDGWTIFTDDGSLSAHFEHTLAVTAEGVVALTAGPEGQGWAL